MSFAYHALNVIEILKIFVLFDILGKIVVEDIFFPKIGFKAK